MKNKGYSKVLEYYLTFDVSDWMSSSKIVDVNSHIKCIDFLKECCINEKILDKINTYKKKAWKYRHSPPNNNLNSCMPDRG